MTRRMLGAFLALALMLVALPACSCEAPVSGYGAVCAPAQQPAQMIPVAAPRVVVPQQVVVPQMAVPQAAPCLPQAAPAAPVCTSGSCSYNATSYAQTYAAPLMNVEYRVGAPEVARATLQVPGNVIVCAGDFVRCALDALIPKPTPTARYVPLVQAVPMTYAAPCVPMAQPQAAPVYSSPCP